MKILAVDDDEFILEIVGEVIRTMGDHEVVTASSAIEAIDFLSREPIQEIDCFLLDIQMPGMDGIELCRALRSCGAFPLTPVVMLTAMTDKRYIDNAYAAGANDYVVKPFEVGELQHRIRQAEQRASLVRKQLQDLDEDAGSSQKPGLLEPIQIFDVDNLIDYYALENYVPLLSRRSLFGSAVVGFHIRKVADIYERCSSLSFRWLIEDVAETISDQLRDYQFLMSYAGNGTFLCVIEEHQVPNLRKLVDAINLSLQKLELQVPTPGNQPVRVCAGDMVRLLGHASDKIENALLQARAHAERRGSDMEARLDEFWYLGRGAQ